MFLLLDFTPFQPSPGLAVWGALVFILFWIIMGKFAFGPIAKALETRENDIQDSLDAANKAKEEMSNLKAENEKLLAQAREERAKMLKEAKDTKNQIINDAKLAAKEEASKIMTQAGQDIENQKKAAMMEVKNEVGAIALSIAEKVIKKQLAGNAEQESYVQTLMNEVNLN